MDPEDLARLRRWNVPEAVLTANATSEKCRKCTHGGPVARMDVALDSVDDFCGDSRLRNLVQCARALATLETSTDANALVDVEGPNEIVHDAGASRSTDLLLTWLEGVSDRFEQALAERLEEFDRSEITRFHREVDDPVTHYAAERDDVPWLSVSSQRALTRLWPRPAPGVYRVPGSVARSQFLSSEAHECDELPVSVLETAYVLFQDGQANERSLGECLALAGALEARGT